MTKLTDIPGIGPATAKLLADHQITTVEALAMISMTELKKISGFNGNIRAQAIKKAAADCMKNEIIDSRAVTDRTDDAEETKKIKRNKSSNSKTKDKKEKPTKKKDREKKNKKNKKNKKSKKDKKK